MLGARYRTIDPERPGVRCKDKGDYAAWLLSDFLMRADAFRLTVEALSDSEADERERAFQNLCWVLAMDLMELDARVRDADLLRNAHAWMLRQDQGEAEEKDRPSEDEQEISGLVPAMPYHFAEKFDACKRFADQLEAAGAEDQVVKNLLGCIEDAQTSLQVAIEDRND
jgi:hypothetical protein